MELQIYVAPQQRRNWLGVSRLCIYMYFYVNALDIYSTELRFTMISTHHTNSVLSRDNDHSQPAPFKSIFSLLIGCVIVCLIIVGTFAVVIWKRIRARPLAVAFNFGRGTWATGAGIGFGEQPVLWDLWSEIPNYDQPSKWTELKVSVRCSGFELLRSSK